MSTAAASHGPLSTTLESIARLHGTFSHHEFHQALEEVLGAELGLHDFTLVGVGGEKCYVLYSTRLTGLRDRLRPPTVDPKQVLDLASEAPRCSVGAVIEGRSLRVEDDELPVVNVWKLGAGGSTLAFLLFHAGADEGHDDDDVGALAGELHRNASISFFKLADRESLQEKLDLYQAKLQAINEVGELIGSLDVEILLTKLLELSLYVVSAEIGSVVLVSREGGDGEARNQVEWGFPLEMARAFVDREGQVLYEKVIAAGEPILAHDFGNNADYQVVGFNFSVDAYLCIPLISKGKCLGVINLVKSGVVAESEAFSVLDQEILMTISGLAATTIENALLHEDSLEKERYAQSLQIARDIQNRMYPSESPQLDGIDIAWRTQSCDETGGDYFDFVPQEGGGLAVTIGDVSGHGIGAALIMASARAGLRAIISQGEAPASAFSRLNDQLEMDCELERFMTLFMARVGNDDAKMQFVNAGHDAPCLYRAATGEVEELGSTGMPLGLFAGSSYEVGEADPLAPGDVLLMTTDGVWEVRSPDGAMMGKPQLIEMFLEHIELPAAEIIENLLADVAAYTGGTPANDDLTILVLRCG